jgi:hypothetical protein
MLHQWFGRTISLLGIAQVPLGLTLYGSPMYTFILFAVWMAFLLLLYFILEYRAYDRPDYIVRDGRSEIVRSERKSSGGGSRWLGPLAAGGATWALLRGRKREQSRDRSRSRSRASRLRSRSRSRAPEVIPSRRASYIEDEKYTDRYSERPRKSTDEHGGGFMNKFLGVGAGLGAGALIGRMMGKRKGGVADDEYSAVATDTPSRRRPSRSGRRHGGTVYSDESEEYHRDGHRSPLLPGPGGPSAMAAAVSAAEARPGARRSSRPITPPPSHRRGDTRMESVVDSDYSSYVSPSRRERVASNPHRGAAEKGLLAGLGLGWFAKKMRDRREQKDEERIRIEEEERRAGRYSPRYTGDGYSPRRESRRASIRPAGPIRRTTSPSRLTEESSLIEPRPLSGYESHPPLEPLPTGGYRPPPTASGPAPPPVGQYANMVSDPASGVIPVAIDTGGHHSRTHSHQSIVDMPPMPPDPHGVLHTAKSSESESYLSRRDRRSESRRRAGDDAAAAAAASASVLAAEEEAQRRAESDRETSKDRTPPVSVKVKVHDDKDRNVTLRRLTEQEALAARRARRQRTESMSSLSGSEAAGGSSRTRYRRDTSRRRAAEEVAEARAESSLSSLPQPTPTFAGGKKPKDSAYYSGQPLAQVGPAGTTPAAGATVSSLGSIQSPGSHGTWSGMSPVGPSAVGGVPAAGPSEASATASAAERRRRRRLERQAARPGPSGTVDFT